MAATDTRHPADAPSRGAGAHPRARDRSAGRPPAHSAAIRERVCAALGYLGLVLDDAANARDAPWISAAESRVGVAVEPTNEEWIAARDAAALLFAVGADGSSD